MGDLASVIGLVAIRQNLAPPCSIAGGIWRSRDKSPAQWRKGGWREKRGVLPGLSLNPGLAVRPRKNLPYDGSDPGGRQAPANPAS